MTDKDPRWHITYDLPHGIGHHAIRAPTLEDAQREATERYGDAVIDVQPATDPRRNRLPNAPGRIPNATVTAHDIDTAKHRIIPDREAR